jgi:hypothetical protein
MTEIIFPIPPFTRVRWSFIMFVSIIAIYVLVFVQQISAQPCGTRTFCSGGWDCCQPNLCCMPSTPCNQRILGSCYGECPSDAVMCEPYSNACCSSGMVCDLVNWVCQTSNPFVLHEVTSSFDQYHYINHSDADHSCNLNNHRVPIATGRPIFSVHTFANP